MCKFFTKQQLIEEVKNGEMGKDIAKKYGCSPSTVVNWKAKWNIKTKSLCPDFRYKYIK